METDIRSRAAEYYDLNPNTPVDVPFYKGLIPSPRTSVLELGCGTGRVLVPLAEACTYIHGIDISEAMLVVCRRKLAAAGIPATAARVEVGDITNFALGRTFDLIIAPYRVFQNLEMDEAVTGLFKCIRQHLAPGGCCALNVFAQAAKRTRCAANGATRVKSYLGRFLSRAVESPAMIVGLE